MLPSSQTSQLETVRISLVRWHRIHPDTDIEPRSVPLQHRQFVMQG